MTQVWFEDRVVPVSVIRVKSEDGTVIEDLKPGDRIILSGKSKGRGFQGVVKRHGFHGGPKSHGQKDRLRAPGSIGATAPQRVLKGRKMAGHMGLEKRTIKNVTVIEVNAPEKILKVKGAIPGMRGSEVVIMKQ